MKISRVSYDCNYKPGINRCYYNPTLSQWLSTGPLAEKYPGISPYTYTADNPVMLTDPDGREVEGCCETLKGFVVGMTDNLLGTNFRQTVSVENVDEFNNGLDAADGVSFIVGTLMMIDGQKNIVTGTAIVTGSAEVTVSSGGLAVEVSAPAAATGSILIVVGAGELKAGSFLAANSIGNFGNRRKNKATDSSKNERYGDRQAIDKTKEKLEKLKAELSKAPNKKEAKKIRRKMNKIRRTAEKK